MKPLHTAQLASWLIVGLTIAPLMGADAERREESVAEERLAQLLTSHDVRYAIHAPQPGVNPCSDSEKREHR